MTCALGKHRSIHLSYEGEANHYRQGGLRVRGWCEMVAGVLCTCSEQKSSSVDGATEELRDSY